MQKRRSNIALIELLIVIFFFSLSAMVIVQVFVRSDQLSQTSNSMSFAIIFAQDTLEQVRSAPDNAISVLSDWTIVAQNDLRQIFELYFDENMDLKYDESYEYKFVVDINKTAQEHGTFFDIKLEVYSVQNEMIFDLHVGKYVSDQKSEEL